MSYTHEEWLAWKEGYDAAMDGLLRGENPYNPEIAPKLYDAWRRGYDQRCEDD